MNHVISYDISDNQLRLAVSELLIRVGCHRLQHSVFAGTLKDRIANELGGALTQYALDPAWSPQDSIFILPLHQYSATRHTMIGKLPDDWLLMHGNLHTLVL